MKTKAVYIPELGETFFIEEIVSITDIIEIDNYKTRSTYKFDIYFKSGMVKTIRNYSTLKNSSIKIHPKEWLESIRSEFLKYTNMINNDEQLKFTQKEKEFLIQCIEYYRYKSDRDTSTAEEENKILNKLKNAQETDKEQLIFPKYLVMQHNYPVAFVINKKDYTDYDSKEELEFIPIKIGNIS